MKVQDETKVPENAPKRPKKPAIEFMEKWLANHKSSYENASLSAVDGSGQPVEIPLPDHYLSKYF